ncbi:Sesquipedalian-1 [Chionoecetes opilio]|uniref:Sesquipedalian-1 n=1 Tax=Chionoecetes opilio TaxID=41210 RepID=A0A8J4Y8M2_CHIOP|nr:Sesquipedalian-1 [Chionoecetes opilio]
MSVWVFAGNDGVLARKKKTPLRELACVVAQIPETLLFIVCFILAVSTERWCRLRGNLLFYFKSRDHWSEAAGVIVLENCQVTLDPCAEAPFAFNLVFEGGTQHCGALCQVERDAWITAIHQASFLYMRQQVCARQVCKENIQLYIA